MLFFELESCAFEGEKCIQQRGKATRTYTFHTHIYGSMYHTHMLIHQHTHTSTYTHTCLYNYCFSVQLPPVSAFLRLIIAKQESCYFNIVLGKGESHSSATIDFSKIFFFVNNVTLCSRMR